MTLIKLVDVSKKYLSIKYNLEIRSNEKVIIKGSNGKGKTTLAKLLCNYIKPDSGKMTKEAINISYLEEKPILPQEMNVKKYLQVYEELMDSRYSEELALIFELPLNKKIKELSKGNLQKLVILKTFIGNFDLYILDEPLNGLDTKTEIAFLTFLNNITETIIVITHFPEKYQLGFDKSIEL